MKPIATLTLNPAIDGASEAETVRPIHKIRTSNERYDPGGGGINVARVIRELGGTALAVYLAGGTTGAVLDDLLAARDLTGRRIPIEDHTRVSHAVYERSSGLEYRFVPEGPAIQTSEWQACLAALEEFDCDYLVASGSLPRGVPADFYVHAAEIAGRRGAKLVLDTSGEALRTALERGGIHLVKPSLGEFEALTGRKLRERAAQDEAAQELARSGAAELVAVTMGHDGALLATRNKVLRLRAPDVPVRSAVGAGDSFVAAMTLALAQGRPLEDAFALGVAADTAAVLTPGTELCKRDDVERLHREVAHSLATAGSVGS
ncbi:MAG: 1-phosphofructokinase family hexose kinase [Pseudomonadota bacterium]|nr:1-phosphofructokinase family hexose kinase [Pseudomonadota bacterium]